MKKLLLFPVFAFAALFSNAQVCTPDQSCQTGLCPDTAINLPDAVVGIPYNTTITAVVPDDTTFVVNVGFTTYDVTFSMDSVVCTNCDDPTDMNLPTGLGVVCSNQNQTECVFLRNTKDCMLLTGTVANPADTGEWPITVVTRAYLTCLNSVPSGACAFFSTLDTAIIVEGYRINVNATVGINKVSQEGLSVSQNAPNPFTKTTVINFTSDNSGRVDFLVTNMLGEPVYAETTFSSMGQNSILFDGKGLPAGIYSYSLNNGKSMVSKRMILFED